MTLRHLPATLALCFLLLITGCADNRTGSDSEVAAQALRDRASLSASFTVTSEESHKLSFHSPREQLAEAKRKLEELRDRLATLTQPTPVELLQLDAAKQQLTRLDAAIDLKDARENWDAMMKRAKLSGHESKLSLDEKRAVLRQQWEEFRLADDAVIALERTYTEAGNNLAGTLRRLREMEQAAAS